jgi:hypothetical protein
VFLPQSQWSSFTPIQNNKQNYKYSNTICHPEDGHVNARNMSRVVV